MEHEAMKFVVIAVSIMSYAHLNIFPKELITIIEIDKNGY